MNQFGHNDVDDSIITIKEYLTLFWSWAWLIILFGLLAGGAAYFVSSNTQPIYQTSTRLLVSDPPAMRSIDYTTIVSSQTLLRTYVEMMTERSVLQGVIDQLGLNISLSQLKKNISVDVVANTQLIVVTVKDADPLQAAFVADSLARVFTERINQMQTERYAASRESLSAQLSAMDQQITDTNIAIENEPDLEQKLQLEARLTQYRALYSTLVTSYEQVRLAEAQTSTNVVVSESAQIPPGPISPNTPRSTLLAVVVGMMLAAGIIFVIEYLDDTLKNPDEIRSKFNLPILGMISSHQSEDGKPICFSQPRSPVAEAFRSLRTNVTYTALDTPLRRILITSATPQEGKTTVSSNLAVVMAQGERKVVLVDADLRRPQVHSRFGLSNQVGLSDLFLLMRPLDSLPQGVIQSCEVPRLGLVTSGKIPPNPSELLTSRKMTQFLDLLNNEYDIVLMDTPPMLTVTDAAALAPGMDGVVVVAKPGVTKLRDFRQMLEQLQTVGARTLGVVLNEVNPGSRKYGYYYNRYYTKYAGYYDSDGTRVKQKNSKTTKKKP
jgi:succinoglycan biosynthesis transport protein ExoP